MGTSFKPAFLCLWLGAYSLTTGAAPARPSLLISTIEHPQISLIENDLRMAYDRLGITVQFTQVAGEREFMVGNRGEVDGIAAKFSLVEQQLPEMLKVNVPLMNVEVYLVCAADTVCQQPILDDPKQTVALLGGENAMSFALRHRKAQRLELVSHEQILKLLEIKRIKYAVVALSYENIQMIDSGGIQISLPAVYSDMVFHYLHRRYVDLIPSVERELGKVVRDSQSNRADMH
ncbi:hypothetical protein [Bowmanella yangjiangensis]|uniref:Solute-binding protein family 3/N-terminal domain-containing protein n=1 Tax=Bowmanella yangjiangensis TaxID=2811230 RepID=A0ABS3CXT4_9ALTE|nr:hypothetical protein [Bowmanella yangjiangensis]MBN7821913.1 hypothetical protein [Bowmanella yangjiangensis]